MSASQIEDARGTAEELAQFERALTTLLLNLDDSHAHRDKLATSHRAADLVDRIVTRTQALQTALAPTNEDRTREIDALTGGGAPGGDIAEFYQRLAKVKDYHRKYPDVAANRVGAVEIDFAGLEGGDEEWLDKRFTGEEGLGRYLDLHELHESWNNLSPASTSGHASAGGWKRLTYLQYLAAVTSFTLSPSLKSSPEYSKYLTNLLAYLTSFYEKVRPLGDLDKELKKADEDFAKAWELGTVPGWPKLIEEEQEKKEGEGIWCAACQKMYSKETVYNAHLTSNKHKKAAAKLLDNPDSTSSSGPSTSSGPSLSVLRQQKNRALALKEALISSLLAPPSGALSQILTDTLSNTERRAALTDRERAVEIEEMEAREAAEAAAAVAKRSGDRAARGEEDDDEEEKIYNPLKLPIGWDGKPIPFWLYKLHGLGVEYTCEICSDYVYRGRKAFERHFQESKHAFGMRALGLPNTKHFHEITRIEDAIALAEKLKREGKQELFQAEVTEELEDADGNVYNRKQWEDLKRQGLL